LSPQVNGPWLALSDMGDKADMPGQGRVWDFQLQIAVLIIIFLQ
jgi:hypothetical protein